MQQEPDEQSAPARAVDGSITHWAMEPDSDAALAELIRKYEKTLPSHIATCSPSAATPTARSSGWTRRSQYHDLTLGSIAGLPDVRQPSLRPALAAVPAQARHGPRAARGDQVRREGAELVEVAHRSSDGCP